MTFTVTVDTLPRILGDERCTELVAQLKADGALDWQILAILANMVCQWQLEQQIGQITGRETAKKVQDPMLRDENENDPPFALSILTSERLNVQKGLLTAAALRLRILRHIVPPQTSSQ